jgi:hypothetical protein
MTIHGFCFVLSLVLISTIFLVSAATPVGAVTVSLEPADTTADITTEVTFRVVTDAFADLKAFELIFWYDPMILELVDVTPGDVLTSAAGSFVDFTRDEFDAPLDSVWYDATVLDGSTAGPGILAFLRFKLIAEGTGNLECRLVDFRDSFNVQTLPGCVAGHVHVVGPVQTNNLTWGRMKTLHR